MKRFKSEIANVAIYSSKVELFEIPKSIEIRDLT